MTNWLKKLINKVTLDCAVLHPPPPMPPVKPTRMLKDPVLSEPVLSFVECYRKAPRRFMIIVSDYYSCYHVGAGRTYGIMDKKTKQRWSVYVREHAGYPDGSRMVYESKTAKWATQDELKYIVEEIGNLSAIRKDKLKAVKNQRLVNREANERNRLMKIYCNKE